MTGRKEGKKISIISPLPTRQFKSTSQNQAIGAFCMQWVIIIKAPYLFSYNCFMICYNILNVPTIIGQ